MKFYEIDPVQDARWAEFVEKHPKASVFHTVGWLKALRSTYGYEPVVFTTSSSTGELTNGLLFCRVKSWLTGRRLVSLPFSDHCEPLFDSGADLDFLIRYLQSAFDHQTWRYMEIRPVTKTFSRVRDGAAFVPAAKYFLHTLDLRPDLDTVFRGLNKDSVQRRIQRAERAGLVEECGASEKLLNDFYRLFVFTRSRQQLPPIPFAWFRDLIKYQSNALEIRVAYSDEQAIAAIITLRFRDVLYYKYGCSLKSLNKFGAIPWLLWKAIVASKSTGAVQLDMGRTEEANAGLLAFKNHWTPQPQELIYWTFPTTSVIGPMDGWKLKTAKRIFSYMPDRLLAITGRLIYRHIG
jgi:lipid II:glycine glycyltransferase (peptidoglycan interpeptide bridge formation enzyme)